MTAPTGNKSNSREWGTTTAVTVVTTTTVVETTSLLT